MKKETNDPKMVRVTFYISEHIEDMLTELYIQRLKEKPTIKASRSAVISDAIKASYEKNQ